MPVSQHGKFVRVQNTYIKIDSIVIVRPKDLVQYDHEDRILSKDFPEIHIETTKGSFPFLFQEFDQRDLALDTLLGIITNSEDL
ncbi:hypothetical protein EZ449_03160 [Pedobacter frigidisoli]|uniref:Uncharacterized protein n=1 Tax=Pedobacter frigidisoli TaxID=2530455 RepID=A0A4R0P5Y7_9SPHI|nr:hypothetical protein [Pedobacter frigidisoli]TCD12037.1 hypothetical protein EZ449_03160 [Pedobacter frigidisoli]